VLAVVWLFVLRPLSVGDIALVFVVSFGVAWLLELLQRRPGELSDAQTAPASMVDAESATVTTADVPADDAPTLELAPATAAPSDAATTPAAASGTSKKSPRR